MKCTRTLESSLVRTVLDYLIHVKRWKVWRNNTGAVRSDDRLIRFGVVGSADILGVCPDGKFLGVECKVRPNKLTEAQEAWGKEIRERGDVVLVVYSLEELITGLEKEGY